MALPRILARTWTKAGSSTNANYIPFGGSAVNTTVTVASTVGATSLTVGAITNMSAGNILLIDGGLATWETAVVVSATGSVVTLLTPLKFAHAATAAVINFTYHNVYTAPANGAAILKYLNGLANNPTTASFTMYVIPAGVLPTATTDLAFINQIYTKTLNTVNGIWGADFGSGTSGTGPILLQAGDALFWGGTGANIAGNATAQLAGLELVDVAPAITQTIF